MMDTEAQRLIAEGWSLYTHVRNGVATEWASKREGTWVQTIVRTPRAWTSDMRGTA